MIYKTSFSLSSSKNRIISESQTELFFQKRIVARMEYLKERSSCRSESSFKQARKVHF